MNVNGGKGKDMGAETKTSKEIIEKNVNSKDTAVKSVPSKDIPMNS